MSDQVDELIRRLEAEAKKKLLIDPGHGDYLPTTKTEWPWEVCKRAFPHDIDAATRFYHKIHGDDPPYLK